MIKTKESRRIKWLKCLREYTHGNLINKKELGIIYALLMIDKKDR